MFRTLNLTLMLLISGSSLTEAAVIRISLGTPMISPGTASFDVSAMFTGDTVFDNVDTVQLSLLSSSAQLTTGGTDFSRFSMNVTLPGWAEINGGVFDPNGTVFLTTPPPGGAPLAPIPDGGNVILGSLLLNLNGLGAGTYNVTFNNLAGAFPTEALGDVSGVYDNVPVALDPLSQSVQVMAVPEPSSWVLLLIGAVVMGGLRWRRSLRTA